MPLYAKQYIGSQTVYIPTVYWKFKAVGRILGSCVNIKIKKHTKWQKHGNISILKDVLEKETWCLASSHQNQSATAAYLQICWSSCSCNIWKLGYWPPALSSQMYTVRETQLIWMKPLVHNSFFISHLVSVSLLNYHNSQACSKAILFASLLSPIINSTSYWQESLSLWDHLAFKLNIFNLQPNSFIYLCSSLLLLEMSPCVACCTNKSCYWIIRFYFCQQAFKMFNDMKKIL